MNKKIKKEWLKALRSGEYRQGRERLHKNGRFCCLGVLYDACLEDEWTYFNLIGEWGYVDEFGIQTEGLSPEMCQRAGIDSDEAAHLAEMNDSGSTFAELSDYIEKNL